MLSAQPPRQHVFAKGICKTCLDSRLHSLITLTQQGLWLCRTTTLDTDHLLGSVSALRKLAPVESTKSTVWIAPRPF